MFQVDYGFDVRKCRIGIDATVRYVGAKTYEDFMPIVNLDFQSMQNMKYWSGTYTARHKGYAVCNAAVNASLPEGMTLTLGQMVTIVVTATLASIGTAGVPGAGLIMLAMVLQSVGLPLEGLALVAGIDRVLDMFRTCLNITGDAAVAVVVNASEQEVPSDIQITE